MRVYRLTALPDDVLLRYLSTLVARDRAITAALHAHLAEVDARKLYAPAGYPSMHAYCVDALRFSDDAAYKRIQAARAARQFPALFDAIADGRLHVTAVRLLAPHLTPDNARELMQAATHLRSVDIEAWLADRFGTVRAPRPALTPMRARRPATDGRATHGPALEAELALGQVATPRPMPATELALGQVDHAAEDGNGGETSRSSGLDGSDRDERELALGQVGTAAATLTGAAAGPSRASEPELQGPASTSPRIAPADSAPYLLRIPLERTTVEKLHRAQAMLGHAIPSGDLAAVLDRALDALLAQLDRRKFAATRPRPATAPASPPPSAPAPRERHRRPSAPSPEGRTPGRAVQSRYVPASVRRAVWERDQGRCTFISTAGHRCATRSLLEFHHVESFARGGQATVEGMRLRCRTHNQHEAEREFGADFMRRKRAAAKHRRGRPARGAAHRMERTRTTEFDDSSGAPT
jgi:hypothetical protein